MIMAAAKNINLLNRKVRKVLRKVRNENLYQRCAIFAFNPSEPRGKIL